MPVAEPAPEPVAFLRMDRHTTDAANGPGDRPESVLFNEIAAERFACFPIRFVRLPFQSGQFSRGTQRIILAKIPLRRMFGYSTDLRSATQGRATYSMQFDTFDAWE